jgi:hypothetical protein
MAINPVVAGILNPYSQKIKVKYIHKKRNVTPNVKLFFYVAGGTTEIKKKINFKSNFYWLTHRTRKVI